MPDKHIVFVIVVPGREIAGSGLKRHMGASRGYGGLEGAVAGLDTARADTDNGCPRAFGGGCPNEKNGQGKRQREEE
jgi:hypothetical protein